MQTFWLTSPYEPIYHPHINSISLKRGHHMLHKHAKVNRPLTLTVLYATHFDRLSCFDLFYFCLLLYSRTVCTVSTISKILKGNNSSLQNGCRARIFTVEQLCLGKDNCKCTAGSLVITVTVACSESCFDLRESCSLLFLAATGQLLDQQ